MLSLYFHQLYSGGDKPGEAVKIGDKHLTSFDEIVSKYKWYCMLKHVITVGLIVAVLVSTYLFHLSFQSEGEGGVVGPAVAAIVCSMIAFLVRMRLLDKFNPELNRLHGLLKESCERLLLVWRHSSNYNESGAGIEYDYFGLWLSGTPTHMRIDTMLSPVTSEKIESSVHDLCLIRATLTNDLSSAAGNLRKELIRALELFFGKIITEKTLEEWERNAISDISARDIAAAEARLRRERLDSSKSA